jgi:hypothetical protein
LKFVTKLCEAVAANQRKPEETHEEPRVSEQHARAIENELKHEEPHEEPRVSEQHTNGSALLAFFSPKEQVAATEKQQEDERDQEPIKLYDMFLPKKRKSEHENEPHESDPHDENERTIRSTRASSTCTRSSRWACPRVCAT